MSKRNFFQQFFETSDGKPLPWWKVLVIFVILFYGVTFAVYLFYSPGPEERRTAEEGFSQTAGVGAPSGETSSSTDENGNT